MITPLEAVHRIAIMLSSTLDADEELRRTLEVAVDAVDAEGGSILRHDPSCAALRFSHVVGGKAEQLSGFSMDDSEGVVGQVFQTGVPCTNNHAATASARSSRVDDAFDFVTRNLVTAPLCYPGGQTVGVIQLVNKRSGDFSDDDLMVLEAIASVSAMSILNTDLARQAEKSAILYYLGDLAHDIKNKVAPIVMGVQTLELMIEELTADGTSSTERSKLRGYTREAMEAIASGADEVHRYTKFLADAAKGKPVEPVFEMGDLGEAASRQVAGLEPQARRSGVTLRCEVEGTPTCLFDSFLINRAVYNLVNNAIPETPSGGEIVVGVRQDEDSVVLEVRDTGCGMPAHLLERVLAGDAMSTKPGGTGLGTAIVKRVVDAHGGTLEGSSVPGKGTTFRIHLPMSEHVSAS